MSHAEIAQSVEQGTENPRVPSSILGLGTIVKSRGCRLSRPATPLVFWAVVPTLSPLEKMAKRGQVEIV